MKNVQLNIYCIPLLNIVLCYSSFLLHCWLSLTVLGDVISSDSGRYWISTYSPLGFPKYQSPGWEGKSSAHIKIDLTLSLKALG
jgi:hypothetical protein